jgi:branched-chain amino acid transport system ATP-binding protein
LSLLEVEELEAGYDDALVLRGVSLAAAADEIVAIIGPNGAGKSTLLKAIYGLVTHRGGRVRFAGDDVTGLRADRLTRRGLNFVPQTDNVFPSLTLAENVEVGALALSRAERRAAVERVSELFPILRQRPRQRAGTLSGGQRKLVALARALVTSPRLLLLDEPSAGLAPVIVQQVFALVERIRASGLTVLIVEQNVRQVLYVVDRAYLLEAGSIRATGAAAELLADEIIQHAYLGV